MSSFFIKQKTAYEMRISDWSSDVCSSDLRNCSRGSTLVSVDRCKRVAAERLVDDHILICRPELDGDIVGGEPMIAVGLAQRDAQVQRCMSPHREIGRAHV